MILSIIIPVYNVEKYVEKCLLSCVRQDISTDEYEIIVVNDGSLDRSYDIAMNCTRRYANIRVISQMNQGLSGARNVGFQNAKGEYVWFVDSDDWIEENCLGRIRGYLKDDLDMLQLQYRIVYEDTEESEEVPFCGIAGIKSGKQIIKHRRLPAPVQFSIFRSQFLKDYNLRFVFGILHEDSEFKPRATYLAHKIESDTVVCYNHLKRTSGSITSVFRLKNGLDILLVMNNLLRFADEQSMALEYRRYFYRMIGMNMNSLLFGSRQLNDVDLCILTDAIMQNKHLFKYMIKSCCLKYQLEGIVFCISSKLGFLLHRIIR